MTVLVFSAAGRLAHLDWDQGHGFHPDERAMAFAVERLSLRPLQLDPGFFAYGSLPLYLTRLLVAASTVVSGVPGDFSAVLLCGRLLSALAGVATVALLFLLGRRLYDDATGLLAALLLACCPLHLQASHFMAVDVLLTLLVLLALLISTQIADRSRRRDFLLAGIATGLALATKASAVLLALPVVVATLQARRRGAPAMAGLAIAAGAALTTFVLAEPYAVLDFPTFWRQLAEQGAIVRHAGSVPYTVQYIGAPRYGYELAQVVLWTMAPALGMAACCGALAALRHAVRERHSRDAVLAAWAVPFFLVTGSFSVKFPRYLLPLYPVLVLWAAAWLVRRWRAGRGWRPLVGVIVVAAVVAGATFLSIYRGEHPAVAASRWFYAHVPPGSTVLQAHWEEGFPLPLPGEEPSRYRVRELPFFAPDDGAKLSALTTELAGGDVLVFTTKRAYGAITRVPGRFPLTAALFRELFGGRLGYRLVHVAASPPLLFGWRVPDELADESLTVYDHPKVLVFARQARLDATEMQSRVLAAVATREVSHRDMLLAGEREASPPLASMPSSIWALLLFGLTLEMLGLAAWLLLRRWLPDPGGFAVAKVIGPVLLAYPVWLAAHLRLAPLSRTGLLVVATSLLLAAGWRAWRRPGGIASLAPRDAGATELAFWGTWALLLGVRAANPAIFWGEKPMDFSLLNALMRASWLPPVDPWFAGSTLSYTYFGHFLGAMLGRLLAIPPGLTFNLSITAFGALAATAAYAAGARLSGSWRTGWLAVALTVLLGNLAGPLLWWRMRRLDFDYFWATSRIIPDTINEFPLWTYLFADLHAHALALPFGLVLLALVVDWVDPATEARRGRLVLMGLVFGVIVVTSGWSMLSWGLLLPVTGALVSAPAPGGARTLVRLALWSVVPATVVTAIAMLLFAPFWAIFHAPERRWGLERGTLADARHLWLIFGLFLAALVPWLWRQWARVGPSAGAARRLVVAGGIVLAAVLSLPFARSTGVGRGWLRVALVALAFVGARVAAGRRLPWRARTVAALATFALLLLAACEQAFLWDRMNTVFKFHLDAWAMLGVASACAGAELWRERQRGVWLVWRPVWVAHATAALVTALTCVYAQARASKVETPRPTLDGVAYLTRHRPAEAAAFAWLRTHAAPTAVIAEAVGPSYGESGRVAMHTGLPAVLGWEYHEIQRGHSEAEVQARRAALERLFAAPAEREVAALLSALHVSLVYVGPLERQTYGDEAMARLAGWRDLLAPVYRNSEVTILAVTGTAATSLPVVDETPTWAEVEPPPALPGKLGQPRSVAVAADGALYIADFEHHRVQVLSPDLQPRAAWGSRGSGPAGFEQPCDVAVTANAIYVADTWNHRVVRLSSAGEPRAEYHAGFFGPRGIAISPTGELFVADTGNHRVVRLDPGGRLRLAWGGPGRGATQLRNPTGLALRDHRVYVCDNDNARLQIFSDEGRPIGRFPVPGWRAESFSEPKVALPPDGSIWVTVPLAGAVRAYDANGTLLREVRSGPDDRPMGLAYDASRRAIVVMHLDGSVTRLPMASAGPPPARRAP